MHWDWYLGKLWLAYLFVCFYSSTSAWWFTQSWVRFHVCNCLSAHTWTHAHVVSPLFQAAAWRLQGTRKIFTLALDLRCTAICPSVVNKQKNKQHPPPPPETNFWKLSLRANLFTSKSLCRQLAVDLTKSAYSSQLVPSGLELLGNKETKHRDLTVRWRARRVKLIYIVIHNHRQSGHSTDGPWWEVVPKNHERLVFKGEAVFGEGFFYRYTQTEEVTEIGS